MKILLDTNFLFLWKKFKIDIFSDLKRVCDFNYRLYVLDKSISEIKKLKIPGYRVALGLLDKNNVTVIKTNSSKKVDDVILDFLDRDTILATLDIELKKKAKQKGFRVITIRKGQYLRLD